MQRTLERGRICLQSSVQSVSKREALVTSVSSLKQDLLVRINSFLPTRSQYVEGHGLLLWLLQKVFTVSSMPSLK